MGAMRSTTPVTTEAPDDVLSSTLSPTTKGLVTNCSKQDVYESLSYNHAGASGVGCMGIL